MAVVKLFDQVVGRLAVERDRRQQLPERAMRGYARVLVAAPEGDDHIALDVGERALARNAESHRPYGPVALETVAVGARGYACVPGCVPIGGAVEGVTLLAQSSPGS